MYKIFDLHNDYFTSKKFEVTKQSYLSKAIKQHNYISTAIWTTRMNSTEAMNQIEKAHKLVKSNNNSFLAIEDAHFLTKSIAYQLINLQPKYCGLTWNYNNNLAGGAHDNGDLTEFGKDIIRLFESSDIFIDTAHLNETSFMSVANITSKPMLCTHTACYELNANERNLKDYQLKIISDSGGLIGVCLVSDFLNGRKSSSILDYIRHIDYIVCKFGIDYVCVGTDFYGTKNLPQGIYDYSSFKTLLVSGLLGLGYKPADIDKILYKNAYDFFVKF